MYAVAPSFVAPGGIVRRIAAFVLGAYLLLFLADGFCSVADGLATLAGIGKLHGVRNAVAVACLLASVGIALATALTPILPKRLVWPPAAFAVLCAFLPPLFRHPQTAGFDASVSALQLVLGLGMLFWTWRGFEPAPFTDRIAGRRGFSWTNLLACGAAALLVGLPLLGLWSVVAGARQVEASSGGFMLLRWNRMEMTAKHYVRDDGKEIELIPMIHLGEGSFYRKVAASFPADSVVLLEGISDVKKEAPRLDYTPTATKLGLASQVREFRALPRQTQAQLRPADIDYSEFSPDTKAFLVALTPFYAHPSLDAFLTFERAWAPRFAEPGFQERLMADVLDRRNAHVLGEIPGALADAGKVVVPWGAEHMPGLERGVLAMGFRPAETVRLDAIHYRTLLAGLKGKAAPAKAPVFSPAPSPAP